MQILRVSLLALGDVRHMVTTEESRADDRCKLAAEMLVLIRGNVHEFLPSPLQLLESY